MTPSEFVAARLLFSVRTYIRPFLRWASIGSNLLEKPWPLQIWLKALGEPPLPSSWTCGH